ncbi:uncharacterized protein DSM5745_07833 [Aspergillus mulundensis]|uniref:Ankyrin repeat protein n=1 Tax=Aspergillus mulundensis TaxID=1810919 RepID=A0A3D8RFM2_9EURO|nr:hypothetical protein DSM5745_07833 [Aspergillus mulundensis]RDW72661.1 hypothetical protein DSM5745_07833 [Aspergillus mulundensis]
MLNVLMPEEFEGQHQALQTTQLKLELYLLSNALAFHDTHTRSVETIAAQDAHLLQTARSLRWHNSSHFKVLLASHEPTAEAIAEELFASAIRLADTRIVKAMLEAGMDPNRPIHAFPNIMTPLGWAAYIEKDKAHRGATALLYAICKNNKAVIKVLRDRGTVVSIECLAAAANVVEGDLFDDLLSHCDNPNGLYQESIRQFRFSRDEAQGKAGGEATLLGAAAKSGRSEIIQRVLQACPGLVNPGQVRESSSYLSHLLIAVDFNRTEVLQTLIYAGVDLQASYNGWTPFLCALKNKNMKVCKILIDNGAQIHNPLSHGNQRTLNKVLPTYYYSADIIHQLKIFKIKTEEDYSRWVRIMLATAIAGGDHMLIAQLANFVVTPSNLSIDEIKDADTAMHVNETEALRGILDYSGPNILLKALEQQKLDLAWWLIDRDVNLLNAKFHSHIPLSIAAKEGNLPMVEGLIGRGSRVTDRELVEAVHCIQNEGGSIDVLQRLLVNFRGRAPSAVALAGFGRRLDLLQLTLSTGADPTGVPHPCCGSWGRPCEPANGTYRQTAYVSGPHSALEIVAAGGSSSALEAVIQSTSNDWGPELVGRALALAVYFYGAELVDRLLQLSPNVNEEIAVDHLGHLGLNFVMNEIYIMIYTALQAAVQHQLIPLVRKLLDLDEIDINYPAKGFGGRTALQRAVECGNWELISLLLSRGADVNNAPAEKIGATALQLAAIKGYLPIASELIRLGANVNAKGARYSGRTALEGAAEHGRIDMVHLLLEHGALIHGRFGRRQYNNAVQFARENCHYATAKLLESFMEKLGPVQGGIVEDSEDLDASEDSDGSEASEDSDAFSDSW